MFEYTVVDSMWIQRIKYRLASFSLQAFDEIRYRHGITIYTLLLSLMKLYNFSSSSNKGASCNRLCTQFPWKPSRKVCVTIYSTKYRLILSS